MSLDRFSFSIQPLLPWFKTMYISSSSFFLSIHYKSQIFPALSYNRLFFDTNNSVAKRFTFFTPDTKKVSGLPAVQTAYFLLVFSDFNLRTSFPASAKAAAVQTIPRLLFP